jgi:peptidoglycan/xylan/chitin deacetylase (PgdA/CDA1 family)
MWRVVARFDRMYCPTPGQHNPLVKGSVAMPRLRFAGRILPALLSVFILVSLAACGESAPTPTPVPPESTATTPSAPPPPTDTVPPPTPTVEPTPTTAAIPVEERGFVPVLCYHHIRDWVATDTEDEKAYIVPPSLLEEQLQWLKENGYTGVVAKDVYEYVKNGKPLPPKPVMLSFDDNDDNQFSNARPLLQKYGFNATFFIMTVTVDKENYMTSEQLVQMDKEGFDLQPHTWDHHTVVEYSGDEDYVKQLKEPKETLEALLGHETPFFAYPFGLYDKKAADELIKYGYKGAFRLRDIMDDQVPPEFAMKRYIANAYWTMEQFATVVEGGWEE